MDGIDLPPLASSLMQSLRALGYSVEAAVADLVDNSIAASATKLDIAFSTSPEPYLSVIDNGNGMDAKTLVEAMRFGSKDPRDVRPETDLGRFGLGLKTASLSQCRLLTVISACEGSISSAEWDLDECEKRGSWWLNRPDLTSICLEPVHRLREQGAGTLVLWRQLDRLLQDTTRSPDVALDHALAGISEHLGLTFHRFLYGQSPQLDIRVNGRPVPRFDPFLEGHHRGQALHQETFRIHDVKVVVTPFVLPFPSRLSNEDLELAGGRDRVKSGHGFYVYRGKRLVVPGGWFRIVPSDDLVRLARVRVDVPVQLDHIWKVDIRKTAVEPPRELRPHLRRIVGDAARRSRKVYEFRGRSDGDAKRQPIWARQSLRDGAVAWALDRQHPALRALATGQPEDTEKLLRMIEQALPLHDIHVHLANDVKVAEPDQEDEAELEDLARKLMASMSADPDSQRRLLERLDSIEPFNRSPEVAKRIAERISQ